MNSDFRIPHWGWWVAIIGGMGLTAWIGFSATGFGFWQDWITAALPQAIFQWIFWLAMLAHVGEGGYAFWLARRQNSPHALRWGLQTFMLGYPSLSLLQQNAEQ
jgi:hypothetical protein